MRQHHSAPAEAADTTGRPPGPGQQMSDRGTPDRLLAEAWITEALLAEAVRVWSRLYRRQVTREEAVVMLMNVKRLGVAIRHAADELGRP